MELVSSGLSPLRTINIASSAILTGPLNLFQQVFVCLMNLQF